MFDPEDAITADAFGIVCDHWSIRHASAGTDVHTVIGLVENYIRLTKIITMKLDADAPKNGLNVSKQYIMYEVAISQDLMLNYDGSTPYPALFGYHPHDLYDPKNLAIVSTKGSWKSVLTLETALRLRMIAN